MGDKNLEVSVDRSNPAVTVISGKGPIVLEHLFKFQEAWRGAQNDNLVFDLSQVEYVDSSAIGSLVNAHVACMNRGKKMGLAGVSDRVKQMLTITKVHSLFTFYPDVKAAEAGLKGVGSAA
jgi:anti-sigma B factor antagonist